MVEKFYIRIFDDNHPNDWRFFLVIGLICNALYFGIFVRMDIENHMFPIALILFNLVTPITMFFCELGERRIYG